MLIAGEASGDTLAAELAGALRDRCIEVDSAPTPDAQPLRTPLAPRFFGAGGPRMAAAGVELAVDMTRHSTIGIFDVLNQLFKFRQLFHQLLALAIERQPDAIIGVDYNWFNLHFAHVIRQYLRQHSGAFHGWNPKIVKYVSPQVWASRPGRALRMAEDYDLLLSIFPFEKEWYARRAPKLRVEFVGHPLVERFQNLAVERRKAEASAAPPNVLLLPGSRKGALYRHMPRMLKAARLISAVVAVRWGIVLPDERLAQDLAKCLILQYPELETPLPAGSSPAPGWWLKTARMLAGKILPGVEIQIGNLPEALAQAGLAIASTGTVTMECAYFGVPAVTLYKASWRDYEIAKRIVKVKSLTMPNLIANEEVYPEFIQDAATPENIARAALELLQNESRRREIKSRLEKVVASLGGPGASRRAAEAIVELL